MNNQVGMGDAFEPKLKAFSERLHAFCAKQNEEPGRAIFEAHFDELHAVHKEKGVPLKTLWEFMVAEGESNGKPFAAGLPKFRAWWYEKAPEDHKPRKKKAQPETQTQGTSTQSD